MKNEAKKKMNVEMRKEKKRKTKKYGNKKK